jgi:hypothetical protein
MFPQRDEGKSRSVMKIAVFRMRILRPENSVSFTKSTLPCSFNRVAFEPSTRTWQSALRCSVYVSSCPFGKYAIRRFSPLAMRAELGCSGDGPARVAGLLGAARGGIAQSTSSMPSPNFSAASSRSQRSKS